MKYFYALIAILFTANLFCQDTLHDTEIGDYIKFNVQAGIVINNSYCNKPRENNPNIGPDRGEYYSTQHNRSYFVNPALNANLLFGKNQYIKYVLGIGYIHSHGEYDYQSWQYSGDNSYYREIFHYNSQLDFINLFSGFRFTYGKHFYIEPLLSINLIAYKNVRYSGYSQNIYRDSYTYSTYTTNVTNYNNEKENEHINIKNVSASLNPRIGYEGFIKKQFVGIYASYNFNFRNSLPWWCVGLTYYPFNALRNKPTENKEKLFSDMKLAVEMGATLNNSYNNVDETIYRSSAISVTHPYRYNSGFHVGVDFSHGKCSYFKHYIGANIIQSKSELHKGNFLHGETIGNYWYPTYKESQYNSSVYFINIGTGFRFIILNHFTIDNGLALRVPIYSYNKIKENEVTYKIINDTGIMESVTVSETPIQNKTSNEMFVTTKMVFVARLAYEFKIKQNHTGVFCSLNLNPKGVEWHTVGLIYYPFKKLR